MAMFNLTQSFGQQQPQGLFSRSWQQQPSGFSPFGGQQQQGGNSSFMQQRPSMFGQFARPQPNFMSYLPLLLSRGMFGLGQQRNPQAIPAAAETLPTQLPQAAPVPIQAQPITPRTTSSAIAAAAARMAQLSPPPPLFTPPAQGTQPGRATAAPAAPTWQPANWFSDPNSAARRIAAASWGNLPLQQQQQFYADTYMGGGYGGDGEAPGASGLNAGAFGSDAFGIGQGGVVI